MVNNLIADLPLSRKGCYLNVVLLSTVKSTVVSALIFLTMNLKKIIYLTQLYFLLILTAKTANLLAVSLETKVNYYLYYLALLRKQFSHYWFAASFE